MAKRKRKTEARKGSRKSPPKPQPEQPPAKRLTPDEAFEMLRKRANHGDPKARQALIRFFRSNPLLWKKFGDLSYRAENAVIEAAAGGEWLVTQAIRYESHELRKSLTGPSTTPLEAIAIDRVIAAWLLLQHVQMGSVQPQMDRNVAAFWMKKLESADKMYRMSLQSLALVRELLPIPVQSAIVQAGPAQANNCVAPTEARKRAAEGNGHVNGCGVNRIANMNGHAPANGKGHAGRLNGNRVTNILDTIGAVAEG